MVVDTQANLDLLAGGWSFANAQASYRLAQSALYYSGSLTPTATFVLYQRSHIQRLSFCPCSVQKPLLTHFRCNSVASKKYKVPAPCLPSRCLEGLVATTLIAMPQKRADLVHQMCIAVGRRGVSLVSLYCHSHLQPVACVANSLHPQWDWDLRGKEGRAEAGQGIC